MIKTHPFSDFFRFGNFQLKARVYCQWQEKGGPYYPGRIVGINKRGQFLVQYDDGDRDVDVSVERLRTVEEHRALRGETPFHNDYFVWTQ